MQRKKKAAATMVDDLAAIRGSLVIHLNKCVGKRRVLQESSAATGSCELSTPPNEQGFRGAHHPDAAELVVPISTHSIDNIFFSY